MAKSPDAFRTISEVAEWLDRPAHVLRFWESKFTQIKPVKRAGGRRYYRPQDMLLLGGIKKLLHDDGMTIKGVQKLLRENGVQHVAALSQPLDGGETIEAAPAPQPETAPMATPEAEPTDNLVAFKRPDPEPAPAKAPAKPKPAAEPEQASLFEFPPAAEPAAAEPVEDANAEAPEAETAPEAAAEPAPEPEAAPEEQVSAESEEQPAAEQAPETPAAEAPAPGILSRIMTRQAKLPGADLAPILQRVRSHADALGKASRDR
ncbi:MerR family transcriptional regulator [Thalassovita mangrovi]|uniref:MerR family transcriptional regulator n=1 Tax=Thalassovita mangrovi TaxID=2692236 RepID=A0A6L8LF81_9RHOB|nr:MerR family transcriptional regulator [Thalassovita mangrovi]MYM54393.1 MerR family transcriptional regulator [Thalassovita mangrovi]